MNTMTPILAGLAIGLAGHAWRTTRRAIRYAALLGATEAERDFAEAETDRLLDQSDDDASIIRALEQRNAELEAAVFMCEDLLGLGVPMAEGGGL